MLKFLSLTLAGLALVLAACVDDDDEGSDTLRLLTHDSFLIDEGVIEQFEAEQGVEVEIIQGGDAGSVVNSAILNAGNPVADVLFGVDNTFLGRALEAELFVEYASPELENVDD